LFERLLFIAGKNGRRRFPHGRIKMCLHKGKKKKKGKKKEYGV